MINNFIRKEEHTPLCCECTNYSDCVGGELPDACKNCKYQHQIKEEKIIAYARKIGYDRISVSIPLGVIRIYMY